MIKSEEIFRFPIGITWYRTGTASLVSVSLKRNKHLRESEHRRNHVEPHWNRTGTALEPRRNHALVSVSLRRNSNLLCWQTIGTAWNRTGTAPPVSVSLRRNKHLHKSEQRRNRVEPHRNRAKLKEALSEMLTFAYHPTSNIYY